MTNDTYSPVKSMVCHQSEPTLPDLAVFGWTLGGETTGIGFVTYQQIGSQEVFEKV